MKILTDHSYSAIKGAAEANMVGLMRLLKPFPDTDWYESEQILRVYTGVPHPMMNGVFWARLDSENLEREVEKAVSFFKQKECPFSWFIGPSSWPETLGEVLTTHGLTKLEPSSPGMAIDW